MTSHPFSSPDRKRLSYLSENRNSELCHLEALAAAQVEHERVREAAIRVYQAHELEEQNRRLREQQERVREVQRREEERVRNEERLRAEEERLRALKAKTVPKLPPEERPAAPVAAAVTTFESPAAPRQPTTSTAAASIYQHPQVNGTTRSRPGQLHQAQYLSQPQQAGGPFQSRAPYAVNPFSNPAAPQQNGLSFASKPTTQAAVTATPKPSTAPSADRYIQIHQNLKKLRASLIEQATSSQPLKQRLGNMRRELRKNLGQLVGEKGGNRKQVTYLSPAF